MAPSLVREVFCKVWVCVSLNIPISSRPAPEPVGSSFINRGMLIDPTCCRCPETESLMHLFFLCPYAKEVWELAPFDLVFTPQPDLPIPSTFLQLKSKASLPPIGLDKGLLFPWILWGIWLARNQKIFESRTVPPSETIHKAICYAREWYKAQSLAPKPLPNLRSNPSPQVWTPPDDITYVCTTDAAWKSESGSAGLGWTFSLAGGPPMLFSSSSSAVGSALVAEALAIRSALFKALELGFSRIKLLSDSLQLIRVIGSASTITEIDVVLADIHICSRSLSFTSFQYFPRSANGLADSLAKQDIDIGCRIRFT